MDEGRRLIRPVRVGIVAGLVACSTYAALVSLPLATRPAAALAAAFGPSIAIASFGLHRFLTLERRALSADLALAGDVVAGALMSAMLRVQIAVKARSEGPPARDVASVWLGLDVAWDAYVGMATMLFALAAWGHPRLGRPFAISGAAIGAALVTLNLATFPIPPADADVVDVGPLVGVWYLAITLRMWRSLGWASARAGAASA